MAANTNTVTLSTNFNVDPYYDDFDETKDYHRILYRPGLAVQGRELTQMQTILQNQIDRFGESIYKEGSVIKSTQDLSLLTLLKLEIMTLQVQALQQTISSISKSEVLLLMY